MSALTVYDMCGITSIYAPSGCVPREALQKATKTLYHRGPDAQTDWISKDGTVGLGHARLSIIDVQTGDQPLANEDKCVHIVVNGEFYDFERIRNELEQLGHVFRTRSDSEIALHLYEEYGTACLSRLRGEFAFVLWDQNNQTLFAARDRFGIKPLYYSWHDGQLYLGSEVKALCAAGVPAQWDLDTLMTGPGLAPDRSHFAGISQVPPGHFLLANKTGIKTVSYWDIEYPLATDTRGHRDEREDVEQLEEIIHRAVKLRLRADVPVACYLSGGIDSCAVLGIASQHSSKPIKAYTLSFDHADYDERSLAEAQARLSGADFFPIEIRSEHLATHFEEAIWHAERPFINAHCVAKFLLSKAVNKDGTRVVLTGEGSDEVFAGYPHFRRDLVLHNTQGQDPVTAARLLKELDEANQVSQGVLLVDQVGSEFDSVKKALGFVPAFFPILCFTAKDLFSQSMVERFQHHDHFKVLLNQLDVSRRLNGRDAVNQSLYLWAKTVLPNYILSNLGDRMEMAHSVEGRVPFLDHELVECVARMPIARKILGTTEKNILREATKPVLTDAVYRRQKHPFLTPPSTLQTDGALHELVQDTLRGGALHDVGIYDRKKVVDMLDGLPNLDTPARTRLDPALMTMLSNCLMQKHFGLAAASSK